MRSKRWILRDASVALEAGQLTCLVGPNGSGKSTLLRTLAGLWTPDEGVSALDGRPLSELSRREIAARVAFVPQGTRVGFDFTVREVVAMGRYPHQGRFARATTGHPAVEEALQRTDTARFADRYITTLSGGEAQRVLLARCLATQAGVLLLDEPTSALDLQHALEVMALCRSLAEDGRAVCLALHDINHARRFADRVIVLKDGRVVAQGPGAEVLTPQRVLDVFGVRAEIVAGEFGEVLVFSGRA